jgi:MoaA/NifB/PqqE/SkfB family radical SAM enzyme
MHLNQTAAEFAYHIIQGTPADEVARLVSNRYRITQEEALKDFNDLKERLQIMSTTQDLDPVTYLDFDRADPYSQEISAPYRLDCALTYRVSGANFDIAPVQRVRRELNTEEWLIILKKAWDAGIPHVIFTGGEPTLREDLPQLISEAEKLGQVTGLLTDGLRFSDKAYLHELLQCGLDHMMFLVDPDMQVSWAALENVLAEDVFTTVHLTITRQDIGNLETLMDRISGMGVKSISLSVNEIALKDALEEARHLAAVRSLSLVWDLPVPYSNNHPVAVELEETGQVISGTGKAYLYVEPDGDVLVGQGLLAVLGNLLTDSWDQIWTNRPRSEE